MGTYRQPSRVLDTSLSALNTGVDNIQKNIRANIEAKKKLAREAEKQRVKQEKIDLANNAKYREYGREIKGKLNELKLPFENQAGIMVETEEGISNISLEQAEADAAKIKEGISPSDLGYAQGFNLDQAVIDDAGGITFDIKNEVLSLYEGLKDYQPGTDEYESIKDQIGTTLTQSPKLISLLDQTSSNSSTAFNYKGELIGEKAGIPGIALRDGGDDFDIRVEASRDIANKANQGRFSYRLDPRTLNSIITYQSPTNGALDIPYETYLTMVEGGSNGLINVTNKEPYDNMIEAVFKPITKAYEDNIVTTAISDSTSKSDKKKIIRQRIKNYDDANDLLKETVNKWVDSGGLTSDKDPNAAQNNWQMMGGTGTWTNSNEQIKQAKEYLFNDIKLRKGGETGLVGNGISTSDIKKERASMTQESAKEMGLSAFNVTEKNTKYFKRKSDVNENTGKATYGYQDLYDNFKTLKSNNGQGIVDILNDGPKQSNYISGAKLSSKTIKANKYKLQDEDGESIALPDPNKIYMKSSSTGTYKALDLYDFDKFMQELKNSRGIAPAKHNKAMNLINTTGPMASNNDETKGEVEITDEVVNEFA